MSDESIRARIKAAYDRTEAGEPTIDRGDFSQYLEDESDAAAIGRQIAYRIRAELVCCKVYRRVQTGEVSFLRMTKTGHTICYWGEASALIAETPEQWKDDPSDHDWSGPDAVERRQARGE